MVLENHAYTYCASPTPKNYETGSSSAMWLRSYTVKLRYQHFRYKNIVCYKNGGRPPDDILITKFYCITIYIQVKTHEVDNLNNTYWSCIPYIVPIFRIEAIALYLNITDIPYSLTP